MARTLRDRMAAWRCLTSHTGISLQDKASCSAHSSPASRPLQPEKDAAHFHTGFDLHQDLHST